MKYIDYVEIPDFYFSVEPDARKEMTKILLSDLKATRTIVEMVEPRRTRLIKKLLRDSIKVHEEDENYLYCQVFKEMLNLMDE